VNETDKKTGKPAKKTTEKVDAKKKRSFIPADMAVVVVLFLIYFLQSYIYHSTYMAAEAYSSPSIILASRR